MSNPEKTPLLRQPLNSNLVASILQNMGKSEIANVELRRRVQISTIMDGENLDEAMHLNHALMEVYEKQLSSEIENVEKDPLVQQIKKFQAEVKNARCNTAAKHTVLAKTVHAVNKELANHLDYRYGAKQGQDFQPAYRSGDLNELMEASKDDTSRYKKVAGCALLAIGIAAMVGALAVGCALSAGILPAALAVSSPVVVLAAAALGGISLGGIPFFKSALKDDKVFDTAGETVKAIHRQTKVKVEGAKNTAFFAPKKSFLTSAADSVASVVSRFSPFSASSSAA